VPIVEKKDEGTGKMSCLAAVELQLKIQVHRYSLPCLSAAHALRSPLGLEPDLQRVQSSILRIEALQQPGAHLLVICVATSHEIGGESVADAAGFIHGPTVQGLLAAPVSVVHLKSLKGLRPAPQTRRVFRDLAQRSATFIVPQSSPHVAAAAWLNAR
jgi:hypothetical protein